MKTQVINIKDAPLGWRDNPDYVYIGRGNGRLRLKHSLLHNPFKIGKDGDRDEVIAKFRAYVQNQAVIREMLPLIQGKTLVCFCAPQSCHGDVLAEMVEGATP